jgi:hypothetical protein
MGKNLSDLRFAVRASSGQRSSTWRFWVTPHGDVYLAMQAMAGVWKYSFHASGICRSAFTSAHGVPPTMLDRAMIKWRRQPTPDVGGTTCRVAWLAFPTDYLSTAVKADAKAVAWIDAAPAGGATYVSFEFSREPTATIEAAVRQAQEYRLLASVALPSGETMFARSYSSDWKNNDLTMPDGQGSDLVFSQYDPDATGRPIRMVFGPAPLDGASLHVQELGGYRRPASMPDT